MLLTILRTKIHRATVTETNLDYIGSVTIDANLIKAAGIFEYEKILVVNVSNGNRLETYCISGEPGSGIICLNGAAAHLASVGDIVILMSFCSLTPLEAMNHKPTILRVNNKNQPVGLSSQEDAGTTFP
ncbi:MAG: aspartate 1-decarboxylase, partial [Deltaproteobacteria bacterium]|nr:aspartate 1-decarboxylase [Deltaproteobacteria bacterium]